ncbi:MAG TPA: universal stress protein [Ktedonobacteraceae bacterium]
MNRCILLGVDAPLSPATRQAIRTIKELIGPLAPRVRLVLLHVISIPYVTSPTLGLYGGQFQPGLATSEQRTEAEKVLALVRTLFREAGLDALRIEICIRLGSPADEILRVAREMSADLIIIGSRGNLWRERVRRFLLGSKSRQVLRGATCPVMIVVLPLTRRPVNLVKWYEEAITRYLRDQTEGLTVFTSAKAAQLFLPPNVQRMPNRKECAAASQALEQLAREGMLCRHEIQGETRYVND